MAKANVEREAKAARARNEAREAKAATLHTFCVQQIQEAETEAEELGRRVRQLEESLVATRRQLDDEVRARIKTAASHAALLKDYEEKLSYERRRAAQALDVADGAASAAGSIGSLIRQLVQEDVLVALRTARQEREAAFRAAGRGRTLSRVGDHHDPLSPDFVGSGP